MASTPLPALAAGAEATIADDFKLIKGIGPAVERRLHDASVLTFAQLAALLPTDIAALISNLAGLSAERITQQDWVGQARQLAPQPAEPQPNPITAKDRQHYATFTVELLLDEANDVRHTRIVHIQDGMEDTWTGWEKDRLVNFVAQYAALPLPPSAAAPQPATTIPQPPTPAPQPAAPAPQPPMPTLQPTARIDLSGKPSLRMLAAAPTGVNGPRNFLNQGQPFDVHLALDLTKVDAPHGVSLNYSTTIYAKRVGGGSRQIIAEASGAITSTDTLTIKMIGTALPSGLYRLEVAVTLTLPSTESDLSVFFEGSLLQVY